LQSNHRIIITFMLLYLGCAGACKKSVEAVSSEGPYAASEPAAAEDVPQDLRAEPLLLIVRKGQYRMRLYAQGKLSKTYVIGLGQEPIGHKQKEGDNRTPEGRYRIIQKALGPFSGEFGAYLGPRWIRLNYPNDHDAQIGLDQGLITKDQFDRILAANRAGTQPLKDTRLGGGIGIHGWAGDWPGADRQNLTWGCISLQNRDLEDLYDRVEIGTQVVIDP
jgi:murein L,D-transpeptidase YafK